MISKHQNPEEWRLLMRLNFTSWEKLADHLDLDESQRQVILKNSHFPLNVPLRLANKMGKRSLENPIVKQFLPINEELKIVENFFEDPVGDQQAKRTGKLLHKYEGRVLLVCTGACVMNCRFCFRQNFNYEFDRKNFDEELKIISEDTTIHEVILSGGDPLTLSDASLQQLLEALNSIAHIKRIRFHTRFPIGIPERITDSFIDLLKNCHQSLWFVVHVNHFLELDDHLFEYLRKLQKIGVNVLSQTVLLKDVNDSLEVLGTLFENLVDHGIIPYYLHQLDRVKGAAHFEVAEAKGKEIMAGLLKRLPGYAVPKYVAEIAGNLSKTPL